MTPYLSLGVAHIILITRVLRSVRNKNTSYVDVHEAT